MVETVEAFVAEHNVGIDEVLYEWPATKFEALYGAYTRRKIADQLAHRRDIEIAAMWGNPNLDNEKDPEIRSKIMNQVYDRYSDVIASLYGDDDEIEDEAIDTDDPFFAAMERGLEKSKLPDPNIND